MKKFLTLSLLFLSVLLGGSKVMADVANFSFDPKWQSNSQTVNGITTTFSNSHPYAGYNKIKKKETLSISTGSNDYTITKIDITYISGYAPTADNQITASPGTISNNGSTTWTGEASEVVFTDDASNGGEFQISSITVTYTNNASGDVTQEINIADLRFEHQTYNPGRSSVAGFNISTNGWQSYTTVNGNERIYTILLSKTGSDNSITITPNVANNTKKIKQVILYGAGGINTFNNATVTSANTRKYSDEANNVGALVWENAEGASSATISINSTDRPHIYDIRIVTDGAMTWTKQSVALSFAPNSGTASIDLTDFSIDGRVKASIGGGSPESFRADEFTVSNSNSAASFNQFHISTSRVGVNTGATAGTATIKATFAGNNFYNEATNEETAGTYTLTIADNSTHTTTITVDDMRISKKVSSSGLTAKDQNLDRTLGGFAFAFTSSGSNGEGIKFNNGDGIIIRTTTGDSSESGKITITPQEKGNSKTVKITRVDIETYPTSNYTNGTVTVSGLSGSKTINAVSSYSFANLNGGNGVDVFTMTSTEGTIYIKSFTIYYIDANGVLNSTKATPTITLKRGETEISSGTSETVSSSDTYTSPTITGTTPKNFDFTITSNNTNVATVAATNWESASLVSLQGTEGTATITATAAESNFFEAATFTYTVEVTSTNSKKWDFTTLDVTKTINETDWKKSGDYYNNQFTTSATTKNATISSGSSYYTTTATGSQIYGLLFGRENSSGLSTGQIRLWSSYLTTNNSAVVIAVPATAGQKVIVTFDGGNSTTQEGFDFTNATLEGDNTATSIKSDETQRIATLTAGTGGYVTLKFTTSKVRLYSIEVKDETRKTLTLADINNTYNRATSNTTFSHYVSFTASDGATDALTYEGDASHLHIKSSNSSVLAVKSGEPQVSAKNFGSGSTFAFEGIEAVGAGTATLTITFDGNNEYKPTSYTSQVYTVSGALGAFAVQADDQAIQQGQRSPIEPIITNNSGQAIGIRGTTGNYETYVLGEEEDLPNYATYFNFTYTPGSGSGTNYTDITIDNGTINTTINTGIGATRNIAITATVKDEYKSAFSGSVAPASTNMTVTIRAKNAGVNPCTYYWNSDLKSNQVTTNDYSTEGSSSMGIFGQSGTFSNGFPNGRMMYVKPKNAEDVIFFSYAVKDEPSDFPAQPKLDKDKKIYIYRRGIPIYIDDNFTSGKDYVRVNVATASYDASTKKYTLNSGVVKMKFIMTTHNRPAQPTYDPISPASDPTLNQDGRKIMNTGQNVVAYGEGANPNEAGPAADNLVYGKFSTSSVYTTAQLINEETVSKGTNSVPVISTEVNKRRFTAVQVKNYTTDEPGNYGDYISEQTYTEYYYLYDTDLRLTPAEGQSSINYNISPGNESTSTTSSTPNVPVNTVTWYNKRNYNNSSATGVTQEVDNYEGKITYAITDAYNLTEETDVSIDPTTGIVTSSTSKQGWVKVTVTYTGGEEHGGKSGEPQYVSTTDKSTADFYVYIYDTTKERPTITPTSRNFTGQMTYRITAPANWDVIYTNNGTAITPGSTTADNTNTFRIGHGQYVDITIGTSGEGVIAMTKDQTHTVKAFAYNPDVTSSASALVVESYTMRDPLPDPVFDPDGTDKDKDGTLDVYKYNTSILTVQIACAYAGSEIYYTTDGSTPEIGATNTYKYSGLSKVVISGNVTIKAVAYDPVNKIFSNVVPSGYQYSDEMEKPYFQISNDGGETWLGLATVGAQELTANGTKWYGGESFAVTPRTQIRIIDPNAVAGTIFYTLDGNTPSDDTNSLIYFEGYPFTVGKTTTGNAITILEDAHSDVASAVFTMASGSYVWEANQYTLTDSVGSSKKGIHIADGFVISTKSDLLSETNNYGTKVNLKSLASGNTAKTTFAQEDITATFGGYDLASWEQMTIADAATGAPIGNVGEYSIKTINNTGIGNGNAKDEKKDNYNHIYSYKTEADKTNTGSSVTLAKTHEKTFKVPALGGYVRFEPEKDGDLTIWCLQQGALLYEDDRFFIPNVLRIRPVYMVDEQGNSLKVKVVNNIPQLWSAARLSENWSKIQATAANNGWKNSKWIGPGNDDYNKTAAEYVQYVRVSDGKLEQAEPTGKDVHIVEKLSDIDTSWDKTMCYKKLVNKGPNKTETAAIYQMYKADLDKNHVSVGDPIKPFAIHTGSTISLNDNRLKDNSDDGTGYVLASGGYAKYTFEVKAGKTYFFFAQGSKIGIRGFQFVPTETTGTRPEVKIIKENSKVTVDNSEMALADAITQCEGKTVNVTLSGRTFQANTWASLTLPFSVSVAQVEKVFGPYTDIIHFDDITRNDQTGNYKLLMKRHWHKMIVAGTPIFIKPTQNVENPIFNGVQLETSTIDEMAASTVTNQYKMTGTLVRTEDALKKDDYYLNGSGALTQMIATKDAPVNSAYAWIQYIGKANQAKGLTIGITDFDNTLLSDDETTGIQIALLEESGINTFNSDDSVYNLNGMKVGDGSSIQNLPKGIYIVKGKKVIVK